MLRRVRGRRCIVLMMLILLLGRVIRRPLLMVLVMLLMLVLLWIRMVTIMTRLLIRSCRLIWGRRSFRRARITRIIISVATVMTLTATFTTE